MVQSRSWFLLALATLLLSTACVTQGTYRELESALEAKSTEAARLDAERAELISQLEAVRAERDVVSRNLSAAKEKVDSLESTYGALVNELRSEVASGQIKVRQVAEGIQVDLTQEILFPSGGWELDQSGREVIERVASSIGEQGAAIIVEGHTDNVQLGAGLKRRFPSNWELSGARAASVVRILVDAGVPPERLRAVGRGPFAPIADNETAEGRRSNRRIQIQLRPVVN
jgi:chemotaxis protein MotB